MRKIIATPSDICAYVFVRTYKRRTMGTIVSNTIGLYRENAIAIESEARDPFGGNV